MWGAQRGGRSSRWALALFGLALCGCGAAHAAEGALPALRSYAAHLSAGAEEEAFRALSPALGARIGRARHRALFADNREELAALGRSLRRPDARVETRAELRLEDGEHVALVLEGGRWRLDGGAIDATSLRTPLSAVAALRRALMRRDLPAIERVLARPTRAEWEAERRRVSESIADPEDLEVELEGERARVRTTGGGVIHLLREAGEWRVLEVE